MKVILLENLRRIGSIGEIIEVKRGFARNFLISNKKALYASKENIAEVEKIKAELGKKDTEKKKEAQKISEQINGKEYEIKKLSTENKELYGSVKPTEISKLIQGINKLDIKPSMIQPITEIKSIGKFKVKIILHSEIDSEITINNYTIFSPTHICYFFKSVFR
jgi:large subunit ribosomal protein L9